jgi:hypothetical protein
MSFVGLQRRRGVPGLKALTDGSNKNKQEDGTVLERVLSSLSNPVLYDESIKG